MCWCAVKKLLTHSQAKLTVMNHLLNLKNKLYPLCLCIFSMHHFRPVGGTSQLQISTLYNAVHNMSLIEIPLSCCAEEYVPPYLPHHVIMYLASACVTTPTSSLCLSSATLWTSATSSWVVVFPTGTWAWYRIISFGQGSSLLWTRTLSLFYSRPIALTQEGSLVNDVCECVRDWRVRRGE